MEISRTTGGITHRISPEVDRERDKLIQRHGRGRRPGRLVLDRGLSPRARRAQRRWRPLPHRRPPGRRHHHRPAIERATEGATIPSTLGSVIRSTGHPASTCTPDTGPESSSRPWLFSFIALGTYPPCRRSDQGPPPLIRSRCATWRAKCLDDVQDGLNCPCRPGKFGWRCLRH